MIVGGTTTTARVEPSNEGRNILNEAIVGGWDQCGGTNDSRSGDGSDTWSGDNNRYVVMMCSWKSYDGGVFLRSSGGRSRMGGISTDGGSGGGDRNGG